MNQEDTGALEQPLRFDDAVPDGGYHWWYLDALSDDGQHGLTLIAFIGSVFSPYYAWARRRHGGLADASNFCALNVALYAAPGSASPTGWTMTERSRHALQRSASQLRIGPSALEWDGTALTVHIHERTAPWLQPVRGWVRLHPQALHAHDHALDPQALHHWRPLAPCAPVEVHLEQPGLHWRGLGYLDSNRGQRPLEQDFARWTWSRSASTRQPSLERAPAKAALPGHCTVLYDVTPCTGDALSLALHLHASGRSEAFTPPPIAALPHTRWRLPRQTRCDSAARAHVQQTLEDGPFYARSLIQTRLGDEDTLAMHESLSLRRWADPAVQAMLPFRMPRRG